MNNISSDEAFSILRKWREEGAILQFLFNDTRTGKFRPWWVLVSKVISEGSPSVVLSKLDPFPFVRVDLAAAAFKYGDSRELSDDPRLASLAEHGWVCFLLLDMPSGRLMMLSELRRDLPVELAG
jgi:hypothetical protein